MIELVKLNSHTFGVAGNALEFTLETVNITPQDIETITIESNKISTAVVLNTTHFNIVGNVLTLNTGSAIYSSSIYNKFTQEDLVIITVHINENAVQQQLIQHGSTECTLPYTTAIFPLYDLYFLRKRALSFLPELHCCDCTIPLNFIDTILEISAIECALKCKEITLSIKLWNKFINLTTSKQKGCGCHGH